MPVLHLDVEVAVLLRLGEDTMIKNFNYFVVYITTLLVKIKLSLQHVMKINRGV